MAGGIATNKNWHLVQRHPAAALCSHPAIHHHVSTWVHLGKCSARSGGQPKSSSDTQHTRVTASLASETKSETGAAPDLELGSARQKGRKHRPDPVPQVLSPAQPCWGDAHRMMRASRACEYHDRMPSSSPRSRFDAAELSFYPAYCRPISSRSTSLSLKIEKAFIQPEHN